MYIIKRGSLSVFVKTDDNRVDQIATLGVGDYFGDQALLRRGLRTASIMAMRNTDLFYITSADVHRLMRSFPSDKTKIHQNMKREILAMKK